MISGKDIEHPLYGMENTRIFKRHIALHEEERREE
jgi:hypothetical protein